MRVHDNDHMLADDPNQRRMSGANKEEWRRCSE
jgi:hypothetical protein